MTTTASSLHDALVREYLPQGSEERLYLDFSGYVTEVVSNSQTLLDKLRDYFRDFLATEQGSANVTVLALEALPPDPDALGLSLAARTPDPGKTRVKEEYQNLPDGRVVRKRLTGMLFVFGQGRHLAVGPCLENDNQVVNFINNRFIEWSILEQGCLLLHAAGVAIDNGRGLEGLALAGFAGMGKSTLALQIMSHGAVFVSNDRLMVRREHGGQRMYGVAKMPRINPGTVLHNNDLALLIDEDTRKAFEAMPLDELWKLEHKYDAFIDKCYGPGRFTLSTAMRGLVLLNWGRPHEEPRRPLRVSRVDLRQRKDLMPAFMKSVGLFFGPLPEGEQLDCSSDAYLAMLEACPVYELTGSADFEAAALACLDILQQAG